jgi:hypothetical protein
MRSTWNNATDTDRIWRKPLLRFMPKIFIAQMIAGDCVWFAILVAAFIAYRRRALGSLLVQTISAGMLLVCNLLSQALQVAETFTSFRWSSQSANIHNNIQGGIAIAAIFGFATGFCWYHLKHARREGLRGFPVDVGRVEPQQAK